MICLIGRPPFFTFKPSFHPLRDIKYRYNNKKLKKLYPWLLILVFKARKNFKTFFKATDFSSYESLSLEMDKDSTNIVQGFERFMRMT